MTNFSNGRQIYVIVSQTGTMLSRLLKLATGARYNHVSVSLDPELYTMYSFGRLNPYNPFWGGFVRESKLRGTFKRFKNTEAVVLAIDIDDDKYEVIKEYLETMYDNKNIYRYNYLGLILAAVRFCYRRRNSYYCSEFVKDLLLRFDITEEEYFRRIAQPIHFLGLPDAKVIYRGKLRSYSLKILNADAELRHNETMLV